MPGQRKCFLDLPQELRDMVYHYALDPAFARPKHPWSELPSNDFESFATLCRLNHEVRANVQKYWEEKYKKRIIFFSNNATDLHSQWLKTKDYSGAAEIRFEMNIVRPGNGKTPLRGALHDFLYCQPGWLRAIDWTSILLDYCYGMGTKSLKLAYDLESISESYPILYDQIEYPAASVPSFGSSLCMKLVRFDGGATRPHSVIIVQGKLSDLKWENPEAAVLSPDPPEPPKPRPAPWSHEAQVGTNLEPLSSELAPWLR